MKTTADKKNCHDSVDLCYCAAPDIRRHIDTHIGIQRHIYSHSDRKDHSMYAKMVSNIPYKMLS